MPTLFDIGEELRALDELIEELGGDITDPTVDRAITQWFNDAKGQEANKLAAYCYWIEQQASEEAAAKAVVDQFTKKARSRANKQKFAKKRLAAYMEAAKLDKVQAGAWTITLRKTGGTPPLIVTKPVSECPAEFIIEPPVVVPPPEIDEKKVRAAIKALPAGEKLDFAHLADLGKHVLIT